MRDCELFLQAVSYSCPWDRDPAVAYGRWDEQGSTQKKPVFGVIRTDDLITPLPPISKILEETVETLRKSGVEVVEIHAPVFKKCQSLANKLMGYDGGNIMFDLLETTEEPLINWLSARMRRGKQIPTEKLVELHAQKIQLETEMLKVWKDPKTGKHIDAIICPVAPHPVPPIDRWNGVSYTNSFVLMDYPAGTVPVRDFKEADLKGEIANQKPLGSWDKVNTELCECAARGPAPLLVC